MVIKYFFIRNKKQLFKLELKVIKLKIIKPKIKSNKIKYIYLIKNKVYPYKIIKTLAIINIPPMFTNLDILKFFKKHKLKNINLNLFTTLRFNSFIITLKIILKCS